MVQACKKAFGSARLATATKTTQFLRVIFGDDKSDIAAGGGYYCQECGTQPKLDFHWTLGTKCGALSGWFCPQGCAYATQRMAGVLTFASKDDPSGSFVMNSRMPDGGTANFLGLLKLVNLIRQGEFGLSAEDLRKAGGLGPAIKNLIGKDNEQYLRLFPMLLDVRRAAKLMPPRIDMNQYPDFEICESPNDVTLRTEDWGRGYIYYDIAQLFAGDEPAEVTDGAWRGLLQTVVSAWGLAEAAAILPHEMNLYTGVSKKAASALNQWMYIRHTGFHAPTGDDASTMTKASASEKEWASKPFDAF